MNFSFTNILDKVTGAKDAAWLFLSYDFDRQNITSVRRVRKDDTLWSDWNKFVREQVDRCMKDIVDIPNEKVYAFSFPKLENIPYLNGENNNHYIQFVSKSVPVYQLGILECAYALAKDIKPTELRANEANYDGYNAYFMELKLKRDMEVFSRTMKEDSENYDLLCELVDRYTDVPEITEKQLEILNASPSGLKVFSVLEWLFKDSDYVQMTLNYDDYDSLVSVPVALRKDVHYLRAEIEKIDVESGKIALDERTKNKRIMELTLFIRKFDIKQNWEKEGIDRSWFSASIARLFDANSVARELKNFQYVPALTKSQLQYLIRTGTKADTLCNSGIMGDVVMATPFFKENYGIDLSLLGTRQLEKIDYLMIEATSMVVQNSLDWLHRVVDEKDGEEKDMAEKKLHEVNGFMEHIQKVISGMKNSGEEQDGSNVLDELKKALDNIVEHCRKFPLNDCSAATDVQAADDAWRILAARVSDKVVFDKETEMVVQYAQDLPVGFLEFVLNRFIETAKKEGWIDGLPPLSLLMEKEKLDDHLQILQVIVEYAKMKRQLTEWNEEMAEKKKTERRIQLEVNELFDKINVNKKGLDKLKSLI